MDNESPGRSDDGRDDGRKDGKDGRDDAGAGSPPSAGSAAAKGRNGQNDKAGLPELPDLTGQILSAVEREAGDVVRCTRVGRDTYRCNWWAPQEVVGMDNPGMPGRLFATHRVRKSQFLEVSRSQRGLHIHVVPDATGRRRLVADG
jgi:hypothetical protein